ncbi:hypothetical protein GZ77_07745 [Endozoicomonas montiporae]|uniref:Uncharacterized protein n=2 Tax=Endozoicomonas montiporae TaxID=1027273 RepID=A0A081N770_9GAMM|nr:hypothetical protein [Endozoicomonas montiporae]AMO55887.1 hypothetical protein EZMO1_1738 [Endozoicomonas montiporae CL-33]KEQ14293.1 hypothetical protein GZ77_07745 [Endozoicomonas montiporae]
MNTEKNSDLLNELERLKVLLDKDSLFENTGESIPLLTDIIEGQSDPEAERQTIAVINLSEPVSGSDGDPVIELRHQLRTEGRRLIRTLIDEELVRIESRLNKELNNHLEELLDKLQPVSDTPNSPWES